MSEEQTSKLKLFLYYLTYSLFALIGVWFLYMSISHYFSVSFKVVSTETPNQLNMADAISEINIGFKIFKSIILFIPGLIILIKSIKALKKKEKTFYLYKLLLNIIIILIVLLFFAAFNTCACEASIFLGGCIRLLFLIIFVKLIKQAEIEAKQQIPTNKKTNYYIFIILFSIIVIKVIISTSILLTKDHIELHSLDLDPSIQDTISHQKQLNKPTENLTPSSPKD